MPGLEADGQLRMTEDGTILDPSAMTEKKAAFPKTGNTDRVKHKNRVKRKKREVVD